MGNFFFLSLIISLYLSLNVGIIWAATLQSRLGAPLKADSDRIYFPDEEDYENCFLNGDRATPGVCKSFEECPAAVANWKSQRQMPQRCYFDGFVEFVCCQPDQVDPKTSPLIVGEKQKKQPRPSEMQCEEFNIPRLGITNGIQALPDEFPFMTALGWTSDLTPDITYLCGGVLISRTFVLTAAHCIDVNGARPKIARIGGGPLKGTNDEENYPIKRIIVHPQYDGVTVYNDIALVELTHEIWRFKPACIWLPEKYPTNNVTAIGYGHTKFGGPSSNVLLKGDIFLTTNAECSKFYPRNDEDFTQGLIQSQICAGDAQQRRDTCQGDSGGPLVMQFLKDEFRKPYDYVVGLTSLGQACGGTSPSIYTKVAHYIDWIEENVWPSAQNVQTRQSLPTLRSNF